MDIESDEELGGGGGGDSRFSSRRSSRQGDDDGTQSRGRIRPSSRPRSGQAAVPVHDPVGNGHFDDEREADELLEDECCYKVFVSLRGRTPGRRMKRTLFKFHIAQLICGFSIFAIACYESAY
jgi:hypothetical protein